MHTRDQLSSRVGRKACSKNFLEAKKTKLEQKVQSLSGWIPSMSIGRERGQNKWQMSTIGKWEKINGVLYSTVTWDVPNAFFW